jgi:acyl-CoA synthetase (AMP-forming)/AMP-acid ligase II
MQFDAVLLPPRRAESIARGYWPDRTINEYLDACLGECPDKLALTAIRVEAGEVRRFTYREMATLADRIAVGLSRLGVGRNDVVAMQLPNWWHFSLLYLACSRIGAVLNPLMPIFRERELSFMLKHGEVKVLVVPNRFRNFDHEAMARGLEPNLPSLQRIVVVDGGGEDDFDALLTKPEWEKQPDAEAILTRNRPSPDDITQLIYTSGTTGEPKGVMHSANTLMANILPYAERLRLGKDDVILMASPMAHQTGFMYGLMMPIMLRASAVLQEATRHAFQWDDPLPLEGRITADERAVRDTAHAYCQEQLLPKVQEAFRHEKTDIGVFRGMGELGLLGATIPETYGGAGLNYVCYGLVAREVERVDAGYRSMMSVQSSLVMVPINEFGNKATKQKYLPNRDR